MTITNTQSGTRIEEIGDAIYQIHTPIREMPGGFGFSYLFTQPGADHAALTESDILGPSEQFRHAMDYFSHTTQAPAIVAKLAATQPRTLACMHGAAWRGDGGKLLQALGDALSEQPMHM